MARFVVIIILSLLVGLVGPQLWAPPVTSKQAAARAQIAIFGGALDAYRLDVGGYPNTAQGLSALVSNPGVANWNGPYLKKMDVPADPWDHPYKYACCPGQHDYYDLWSEGADGAPGGDGENADVRHGNSQRNSRNDARPAASVSRSRARES